MKRLIFFLSLILSAQQAIDSPPLAHVLDSAGRLTPIHGLAGNFRHPDLQGNYIEPIS